MQLITASDLDSLVASTFLNGVTHFEEIDSTNSIALARLDAQPSIPVPHLIYAETQTAGRGRGANAWWSAAGSLTFTLIIDSQKLGLSAEQQMQIPLMTGLAVLRACDAMLSELPPAKSSLFFTPLEERTLDNATDEASNEAASQNFLAPPVLSLKWPNDVYLTGKKLAGILCEVPSAHRRLALVGVGINVNNSFAQTSAESSVAIPIHSQSEIQAAAISLSDYSGHMHNRLWILKMFIEVLETFLKESASGKFALDAWRQHCLLTGKTVTLQTGNTRVIGLCRGVADSGAIILETAAGPQELLGGSIVSWR